MQARELLHIFHRQWQTCLIAENRLMLCSMILENAADVLHAGNPPNIQEENHQPQDTFQKIQHHRVFRGSMNQFGRPCGNGNKEDTGQYQGKDNRARHFLIGQLLVFLAGIDYAALYGSENGNLVNDIRYSYSDSRGAAAAIAALPEDAVVVESLEDVCNAVVAFLPPGRIVNPFLDEPASYANRNRDLPHRMSWKIFQRYCHRSFRGKEEFYLLYTPACAIKGLPVEAFEVVYEPQGEVATSEWFKLLRIPVS